MSFWSSEISDSFAILLWMILYITASITVLLVIRARTLNLNYKYGIISTIGLLAFCIIYLRMQTKPYNRTRLFYLNDYYRRIGTKHASLLQKLDYQSIYQDYAGLDVDIRGILDKKRFINIFEAPPNFELMDVIVEILEKKGQTYLYCNLHGLPRLESRHHDKDEFWGLVAQSIIINFQRLRPDPMKNVVLLFDKLTNFHGDFTNENQLSKWNYFAQIVDTIYKRLEYVNIIIVTENSQVTDYLEGKHRITISHKAQLHCHGQENQGLPCRETAELRHQLLEREHERIDHSRTSLKICN